VGRSVRYFGVGLLALWYGRQTLEFLHRHGRVFTIVTLGLFVLLVAWLFWRRRGATKL
jgi:uncharacterized protein (TIGR03382 family)